LAFPGFVRRWKDPLWHEPIRLGTHFYIESNRGGGDVESAIVIVQAAMELLACTLLVEHLQKVSESDFDSKKYPAHIKIRETLVWAGIPTEMPDSLTHLSEAHASINRKDEQRTIAFKKSTNGKNDLHDGPRIYTSTRNWIGHPTKRNREKFRSLTSPALTEAWTLGVWYLELLLLRLMDFDGLYSNRLVGQKCVGEVEPVPWVTS
jgi:hypothetical protein